MHRQEEGNTGLAGQATSCNHPMRDPEDKQEQHLTLGFHICTCRHAWMYAHAHTHLLHAHTYTLWVSISSDCLCSTDECFLSEHTLEPPYTPKLGCGSITEQALRRVFLVHFKKQMPTLLDTTPWLMIQWAREGAGKLAWLTDLR